MKMMSGYQIILNLALHSNVAAGARDTHPCCARYRKKPILRNGGRLKKHFMFRNVIGSIGMSLTLSALRGGSPVRTNLHCITLRVSNLRPDNVV